MIRAMQSALRLGAKGIRVCLAGRLAGNEIARTEWLREGSVPLHTFRADVDYAETEALTILPEYQNSSIQRTKSTVNTNISDKVRNFTPYVSL